MKGNRILVAQQRFTRLAVAACVAGALVLTYDGTVRFAQDHGAYGWRGWVIAAMNDLVVLVGILWPEKPLQAVAALCSTLTIWANVDHAAPGFAGVVIALVPPVLAVALVVALEIVLRRNEGAVPVTNPQPLLEGYGPLREFARNVEERFAAFPTHAEIAALMEEQVRRIEAVAARPPQKEITRTKRPSVARDTTDSSPRKRYAPGTHPKYLDWELAYTGTSPWSVEDMQKALGDFSGDEVTYASARSMLQRWERHYAEQANGASRRPVVAEPTEGPAPQGDEGARRTASDAAAGDPG